MVQVIRGQRIVYVVGSDCLRVALAKTKTGAQRGLSWLWVILGFVDRQDRAVLVLLLRLAWACENTNETIFLRMYINQLYRILYYRMYRCTAPVCFCTAACYLIDRRRVFIGDLQGRRSGWRTKEKRRVPEMVDSHEPIAKPRWGKKDKIGLSWVLPLSLTWVSRTPKITNVENANSNQLRCISISQDTIDYQDGKNKMRVPKQDRREAITKTGREEETRSSNTDVLANRSSAERERTDRRRADEIEQHRCASRSIGREKERERSATKTKTNDTRRDRATPMC